MAWHRSVEESLHAGFLKPEAVHCAAWLLARGTFAQPLRFVRATGDRNFQDRGFEFRVTLRPLELLRRRG